MGVFDGFDPRTQMLGGYCIDIAMLIDATGSMAPIIEEVKQNAMAFCEKFHQKMEETGRNVEELRIKVIPYRDYKYDGDQSMAESAFFSLPEQNEDFRKYVENITAKGGGDEPESALEAMALAMRSDWTTKGAKRRHVILVFTDASAVPLGDPERTGNATYPANMPKELTELGDMWKGNAFGQELGGMPEESFERLVLFTPDAAPWSVMQGWNNVWPSFSKAGHGLEEIDIDMAISLLVGSVG